MTALLTENLPLLAGAPNGIKNLRELILELAVRGKLVPQDPSDEPADELLKRVAQEKARLVDEGKIRKQKPLTEIGEEEKPFELPANWRWGRLGSQVIESGAGWSPSCDPRPRAANEWGVLKVSAVSWGVYRPAENKALPASLEARPEHEVTEGDFLVSRANTAELVARSVVVETTPANLMLSDKIVRLKLTSLCERRYVNLANSAPLARDYYSRVAGGTSSSMKNVSREQILNLPLALPPLAEQHRIVAKVDELMALCDRLEAEQADAESAHAQLVQALLDSLTQACDATDFASNWQRLAEHFHTLFTTESSIDALKKTLLQLAVIGKLVPQEHNDEPASELLKRIAEEKARLVAEGKIKKQKPLADIEGNEVPFALPDSWTWTRFGNICAIKGELVRPEEFPSLRQVAPDCIEKGTGRLTDNRTVKESGVKGPNSRFFAGQIIYSKIRPSLSKAVLVDFEGLCSADMYPIDAFISSKFLLKEILSEVFLEQVRIAENRIKMPKLNQESLTSFVLPIPPLAEQHRIVAAVDQLMDLCDQLKTRLTQARLLNEQLASTLVEQAVA